MRNYFVVFAYKDKNSIGISNLTIKYKMAIRKIEDIEYVESYIKQQRNYDEVKIISWKKIFFSRPIRDNRIL